MVTPAATDLVSVEYEQHKAEVIRTVAAKLSAAGIAAAGFDLEASYNEAWHALYMAMADGEEIENRVAYLVTVTYRRALNEFRAFRVNRRADPAMLETIGVDLDLDARLDAEIQVRHIREGLRAKLSPRELEAATLCHLYGYTRPEAAEVMGVRPKRMEKIMDRAAGKIGDVVETVRAGEHCAEMSSTIRAFAMGMLEPGGERYGLATDHLEHCPACRREVRTDRGLAAIGPPLPIAFATLAGGAAAGGGAAGGLLALKGGGHGAAAGAGKGEAAAAGGKAGSGAAQGGGSIGSTAAVAGTAVAAVAVVATAAAFATGIVGGGSDPGPGDGAAALTAAGEGDGQAGSAAIAAAKAKAAARAARAAKARARRAKARAAAKEQRKAAREAAAAKAAAAAEATAVAEAAEAASQAPVASEPVYVPPPPPDPAPVAEPEAVKAELGPKPKREDPAKPTTDAGEEFGLR
ncbi:MAG: sigma-70 family RNA polymerase sigma factor [Solirubrobacterales bacterium]|nr:sigma-70 family RNA polymerase sigma factor [Solirubrobacterales bacterium]